MGTTVYALVLAAGRSSRMGEANKLLADVDGAPLVTHAVDAALASLATGVVVVTGHDASAVRQVLEGREVAFAHNADYASGLGGSLAVGMRALPDSALGVLVCLGDMPRVTSAHLDALITASGDGGGDDPCVPFFRGRRGNPVLWPARCFESLRSLTGDAGGRGLLAAEADRIVPVEVADAAIHRDVDTAEDLRKLAGR